MKTFKQYVKEALADVGFGIGTIQGDNPVEDGNISPANLENKAVLEKVNAFVGAISAKEYLNPNHALNELKQKLMRIGINAKEHAIIEGDSGKITLQMMQHGGRFGKGLQTPYGEFESDDGISHRKEGGLKLEVKYAKQESGSYKVDAKLV